MTGEEFLSERAKLPTFSAEEVYRELRSKNISTPGYSKDLLTIVDYLKSEAIRFPKQHIHWLTNKIVDMAEQYVSEKESEMARNTMIIMMSKRLPPKL